MENLHALVDYSQREQERIRLKDKGKIFLSLFSLTFYRKKRLPAASSRILYFLPLPPSPTLPLVITRAFPCDHQPSGAFGGGGQLSVLYISEASQHFLEQKSTGSKQTQMPQKLIWYGSPSILTPHSSHQRSTVP